MRNSVNGARVTFYRGGANQGTWPCWGGSIVLNGFATFAMGEMLSATQEMCPGDPASNPGTTVVQGCSSLPAPGGGPVQAGDTSIGVTSCRPDAVVKEFVKGVGGGASGPPGVDLGATLNDGDPV